LRKKEREPCQYIIEGACDALDVAKARPAAAERLA